MGETLITGIELKCSAPENRRRYFQTLHPIRDQYQNIQGVQTTKQQKIQIIQFKNGKSI